MLRSRLCHHFFGGGRIKRGVCVADNERRGGEYGEYEFHSFPMAN